MPMTRYKPGQIVTLLRQIEVAIANAKSTRQACKEAQITAQTYYRWRKEYGFRKHYCVRGRVDLGHAQACGTEVVRGDQPASLFLSRKAKN